MAGFMIGRNRLLLSALAHTVVPITAVVVWVRHVTSLTRLDS